MSHEITVKRFFTMPTRDLFDYFVDSSLIEKWSYPNGMSLRVSKFEAFEGGRYRYEHMNEKGTFTCEGHIERIIPQHSIKMIDEYIKTPDGKTVGENLGCEITFRSVGDACEVTVCQTGLESAEFARECESGWSQCLDHLQDLTESSVRSKGQSDSAGVNNHPL